MKQVYEVWTTTIIPAGLVLLLSIGFGAMAQTKPDSWDQDGEHGVVHVTGALTEGTCVLDMASEYQEVQLGETATALLRKPGNQGTPVIFHLQLRDCLRTGGWSRDRRTDTLTWDSLQPVVTVSFVAPADADVPSLIGTTGVTGIGLLLQDSRHRVIRLGGREVPQFTSTASDELVYTVTPVRTPSPLTPGSYRATVDFRLNYD